MTVQHAKHGGHDGIMLLSLSFEASGLIAHSTSRRACDAQTFTCNKVRWQQCPQWVCVFGGENTRPRLFDWSKKGRHTYMILLLKVLAQSFVLGVITTPFDLLVRPSNISVHTTIPFIRRCLWVPRSWLWFCSWVVLGYSLVVSLCAFIRREVCTFIFWHISLHILLWLESTWEGPKSPFCNYNSGKKEKEIWAQQLSTCRKKIYVLILSARVGTSEWKVAHMHAGAIITTWCSSMPDLCPTAYQLTTRHLWASGAHDH